MKRLNIWTHRHPLTLASFTALFGYLTGGLAFRDDWAIPIITIMAILFGLWVLISWWQMRGVALLLALCLAIPPLEAKTSPADAPHDKPEKLGCAAVAVGAVVVVVGIVVGVKLYKFCQKKFPKTSPTNAPPDTVVASAVGSSVSSAALEWSELGSCDCTDQSILANDPRPITTVTLTLRVDTRETEADVTVTPLSMVVRTGPESHQGWAGLAEEASELGLTLTGHAGNYSFARDGHPISAEESPISWNPRTQNIRISGSGRAAYTVVVDRSPDMGQWLQVLKVEVEAGATIEMHDTNPARSQFYRYWAYLSD